MKYIVAVGQVRKLQLRERLWNLNLHRLQIQCAGTIVNFSFRDWASEHDTELEISMLTRLPVDITGAS